MVKANPKNKSDAVSFIDGISASEATNIFEALELAFMFAGMKSPEKHVTATVDAIFFLTDGGATEGRLQDSEQILRAVRRLNRTGQVKIHTIGVGYLHDRSFLEELALQNGGEYVNVQ